MSDWDDLFALASGNEDISHTGKRKHVRCETKTSKVEKNQNLHKKKSKRRNSKFKTARGRGKSHHVSCTPRDFSVILKSRMEPIEKQIDIWPPWISLGSSLIEESSSSCKRWKESSCAERDISSSKARRRACDTCKLNPLYHSIVIDTDQSSEAAYLFGFALIRDIRCCCSSIFSYQITSFTSKDEKIKHPISAFANSSLLKARKLMQLLPSASKLPDGEAEILDQKFRTVLSSAQSWYDKAKRYRLSRSETNSDHKDMIYRFGGMIEEIIKLVVDCDYAYYRLYYLQITGQLPVLSINGELTYIPHPTTYFGTDYLTWDIVEGKHKKVIFLNETNRRLDVDVVNTPNDTDPHKLNEILLRFGLFGGSNLKKPSYDNMDPLTFLHGNRLIETILIFWVSGWVQSDETISQVMSALDQTSKKNSVYEKNETPAPRILMQWRDCCRDLLCNLYAFTTLPPKTLFDATSLLQQRGITGIVELGSGTGYVANLFKQFGVNVNAIDAAPTVYNPKTMNRTMNEYHGCTPAYLPVAKGDVQVLSSTLHNENTVRKTALLLCYPPPGSEMAHDAASTFVSSGGRCIIHVGEFRGLTGTIPFETYLANRFHLVLRKPCLQWGTDTAEMTIWMQGKTHKKKSCDQHTNHALLIPCINCNRVEAKKRCRLSRSLVYCSLECFQLHYVPTMAQLSLSMISPRLVQHLDFNNANHFSTL